MKAPNIGLLRREFELRILVSLGIVAVVCAVSALFTPRMPSTMVLLGGLAGAGPDAVRRWGFVLLALVMTLVSLLRMWAGTELTAHRVMAFRVQVDEFHTRGPYRLVRNPIYLADFIAMCAFSLCLPPVALVMPLLFGVHYGRLITFEEISLSSGFRERFQSYAACTPRLFPACSSTGPIREALGEFYLSREGIRHNSLYVLFIPGFIAAAWTREFLAAALIGLPAVADWAIVHTRLGRRR